MWYIEQPSEDTLNWFKNLFLDPISDSINSSDLSIYVKNILNKDAIKRLMLTSAETLYSYNEYLETELDKLGEWNNNKSKLLQLFDYENRISKNKNNSYELSKRIGRNTCVYCNRIYTHTVTEIATGRKIIRPDFDHWLSKAEHPLLSMSIYNLIPSCPICNRGITLQRHFQLTKHIHPYLSAPETSFKFQYVPLPNAEWDVKITNYTEKEFETAKILETEQVYKCHGNLEVKDIVEFAYKNSPQYLNDLYSHVLQAYCGKITAKEAYRVIMGAENEPSRFLDRPLAKLKRDILLQIKESLCLDIEI